MFKPFYCCFGLFFRRTSFCSSRSVHPALQAVLCSPCIANVLNFLIQRRPTRTLFYSNFQGFTYCSIFDFQGSRALSSERRRRDLNPRAATNDLLPFQGSPFNHLGTSALVDSHLAFLQDRYSVLHQELISLAPQYS